MENMKENFKMESIQDKESLNGLMEVNMQEILKKGSMKDMGNFTGKTVKFLKVPIKKVLKMDLEKWNLKME